MKTLRELFEEYADKTCVNYVQTAWQTFLAGSRRQVGKSNAREKGSRMNCINEDKYVSVVELCANHPGLAEYIEQMENDLHKAQTCLKEALAWFTPYVQETESRWRSAARLDEKHVRKVV